MDNSRRRGVGRGGDGIRCGSARFNEQRRGSDDFVRSIRQIERLFGYGNLE